MITTDQLKAIIETDLSTTILQAYITTANTFLSSTLPTTPEPLFSEIEKYMAAHLLASTRERMAESEEAGGAKIKYLGKYMDALHSTPYGQMAMVLDTTGTLRALSEDRKPIQIIAL